MIRALYVGVVLLSSVALTTSARACNVDGFEPNDIDRASVVVVGEVRNYQVVPNDAQNEQFRRNIEDGTAPEWQRTQYRRSIADGTSPAGYVGRFDIAVEKVLKGRAKKTLSVTLNDWVIPFVGDDSGRLPKSLAPKRYLIALVPPNPEIPLGSAADARLLTVYIGSCLGPFMEDPSFATEIESYRKWMRQHGQKRTSQ